MNDVKIAACQPPYVHQDIERALSEMIRFGLEAESEGADLVCFPECYLQGYVYHGENTERLAMEVTSPAFRKVLDALSGLEPTLVMGFIEADGSRLYNTAAVIRKGVVVGCYRKTKLLEGERRFDPGTLFPVFAVKGRRFGIIICNDLNFPKAAAEIRNQGAELLICPCNNMMRRPNAEKWKMKHNEIRALRARETGMWLMSSDVTGEWAGRISYGPTAVITPDGIVSQQVELMKEGMILHTLSTQPDISSP